MSILLGFISIDSYAASSQLYFTNAAGLGNAYSGDAAAAEDASTEYTNPAGLSLIHHTQFVFGNVEGRFNGRFVGTDTYAIPGVISIPQTGLTRGQPVYGPYPFVYLSIPLPCKFTFGFGILTPFGIGVSIPDNSLVRYAATRFVMYDIDLSPAISYQINDQLSAALALDIQRLSHYTRAMSPSLTGGPDAKVINDATGWGYGWHAGILYQMTPCTRVGLNYLSRSVIHPRGQSEYVFIPGSNVGTEIISNNYKFSTALPPTVTASIYSDINPQWALLGTIGFTQWSIINQTVFYNIANPTSTGGPSVVNGVLNQYYRDTWRFAGGVNYKFCPKWMLRLGASYDSDPTNDTYRPLSDPGSQAISLAIGIRYQAIKTLSIDAGYMHAFVRPSSVNTVSGLNTELGTVRLQRDAAGLQITWNMA